MLGPLRSCMLFVKTWQRECAQHVAIVRVYKHGVELSGKVMPHICQGGGTLSGETNAGVWDIVGHPSALL